MCQKTQTCHVSKGSDHVLSTYIVCFLCLQWAATDRLHSGLSYNNCSERRCPVCLVRHLVPSIHNTQHPLVAACNPLPVLVLSQVKVVLSQAPQHQGQHKYQVSQKRTNESLHERIKIGWTEKTEKKARSSKSDEKYICLAHHNVTHIANVRNGGGDGDTNTSILFNASILIQSVNQILVPYAWYRLSRLASSVGQFFLLTAQARKLLSKKSLLWKEGESTRRCSSPTKSISISVLRKTWFTKVNPG